jgi:hypothetical protein
VTTSGNVGLARAVASSVGVKDPTIDVVRDRMTLGSGDGRIDIYELRDDPHVEGTLLIHLPGRRIAFEGDLSDYVPSARNLLRFVDGRGLVIEKLYRVHGARALALDEISIEEPWN